MIGRRTVPQEDGSEWQYWDLSRGELVITSSGQGAVIDNPNVLRQVRDYRAKVLGRFVARPDQPEPRVWFASGGNSDLYELAKGSDILVKETSTAQAAYWALQRMDRLKGVIEDSVPRWIDIPEHFAVLSASGLERDYLLLHRVNSGITVADIINPDDGDFSKVKSDPRIRSEFGYINDAEIDEIGDRFNDAKTILDHAIISEGLEPDDFLPDWDVGNVLVEKLRTPVAGSRFMLWVFDQ